VPNPFNPRTQIVYSLDAPSPVEVKIYDAAGRAVWNTDLGPRGVGEGSVVWNGCDATGDPVASGVYRVRLVTSKGADELAVTLLR